MSPAKRATALLATFTTNEYLDSSVRRIFNVFELESNKIFMFNDLDDEEKKILTYNILLVNGQRANISKVFHTICINRKKESNTLYTINSLNRIVEQEIGHVDPKHQIQWQKYRNMFITSDKNTDDVTMIRTELYGTIEKDLFFETGDARANVQS